MVRVKLTDPKLIFAATIAGGVLGTFVPAAGLAAKPIGDLYIAALSIAIVPLMMTAVISGIAKMLRSPSLRRTFPRFAITYLLTLMIPGAIAIGIGLLVEPGLGSDAVAQLGERMSLGSNEPAATNGLYEFLVGIVPSNIFQALTTENFAAIVIFSVLLGVGLGVVDAPATDETIRVIHSLYETFSRIFQWILAPLAIGLFCLMAGVA
ncbi:MAG: dicarboxylate/amino acid:cation symporter, partial [Hyphomicrobiales bacterium]|nr:dicarboxylate/amino acid:cation symporter [Hyphomicrobiales bacterium]